MLKRRKKRKRRKKKRKTMGHARFQLLLLMPELGSIHYLVIASPWDLAMIVCS